MKKLFALFIALGLAVTTCACSSGSEEKAEVPAAETTTEEATKATTDATTEEPAEATETPSEDAQMVLGTLSLLNVSEEDYGPMAEGKLIAAEYLSEQGVLQRAAEDAPFPTEAKVVFYDTLDAMVMALEAGDINSAEVPVFTADYLCAHNDKVVARGTYNLEGADDFTKMVAARLGVGYSFLTTEDNTELRDKLDQAITEMQEDGTLDALTQAYINDAVDTEPEPVEFAQTDGETVRVAITGALPPMDYVAADGTPAGFNTALLAELGKRLDVNFELVQVDSVGRAAALSSGQVDLVFWSSGFGDPEWGGKMTKEDVEESKASATEEQIELMRSIGGENDYADRKNRDIPEGTITTQSYYNDRLITICLK